MVPAGARPWSRAAALGRLLAAAWLAGCGDDPAAMPAPAAPPGEIATALSAHTPVEPPPAVSVDRAALDEVIDRVRSPLPPTSASGTLVGSDTGILGEEKPLIETDGADMVSLLPKWAASNAGSERDLRGTLYFDLVNECRGAPGTHLPPEAVEIELVVDAKGQIDRASVKARGTKPEYEAAAACMVRVARTSEAKLTPPRLERPIVVRAKVPSVD